MANPYAGQAAGGAQGGWQGLGGLMQLLQGGVNQSQYNNMLAGANGSKQFGAIGGAHGAGSGLSPWAISYLMQNLMTKQAAPQQALTNPDGTPLTGAALQMATLENSLSSGGPATYKMGGDVTTDMLSKLLQDYQSGTGHQAYTHGDTAEGRGPIVPDRQHGGMAPGVFGYGLHGGAFHSRLAAIAAGRLGKGGPPMNLHNGLPGISNPLGPRPGRPFTGGGRQQAH